MRSQWIVWQMVLKTVYILYDTIASTLILRYCLAMLVLVVLENLSKRQK